MKVNNSFSVKSGCLDLVGWVLPAVTVENFANFHKSRNSSGTINFQQLIITTWNIIILYGLSLFGYLRHCTSIFAALFFPKFIYSGFSQSLILQNLVLGLVPHYGYRKKIKKTPPWLFHNYFKHHSNAVRTLWLSRSDQFRQIGLGKCLSWIHIFPARTLTKFFPWNLYFISKDSFKEHISISESLQSSFVF